MQNHFELFQLPEQFHLEQAELDAAFREIQSRVHPDKFVQASPAEKRVAMQWSTLANEAYQTLKKPLSRATYLCHLHGIDLEVESNTSMPAAFLMQQMEWREAFDDARMAKDLDAMLQLESELNQAIKQLLATLAETLNKALYPEAAGQIRACMFLEKFKTDIGHSIEQAE